MPVDQYLSAVARGLHGTPALIDGGVVVTRGGWGPDPDSSRGVAQTWADTSTAAITRPAP
ncbi:hypothetical protein DMP17_16770 [Pseudonocardia sp. TMWB2A]|uniref:hypothetical protein n=1 Tax=Pseudonocardia sp. TMWB2A TaxID=687430 RepID=UPI00307F2984